MSIEGEENRVASANVTRTKWGWREYVLLAVVLLLSTVVRVAYIDEVPSFDELWHMATTKGYGSPLSYYAYDIVHHNAMRQVSLEDAKPIWMLWSDARGVLHPPLFLLALRVWRDVVGESVFVSHLFSITWGAIGLAFLFATARLAMNRSLAAIITLAFGVAQTQVYISQEIRPYAMLNAIGACAIWMMTRVVLFGPTRSRAIFLALITLPMVMTHYFGLGGAIAVGIFALLRLKPYRRAFVAVAAACAIFFIVAWVPFALRQTRDFATGDSMLVVGRDLVFEFLNVAGVPFRLFAERDYHIELMPVLSGVLFLLPWLFVRRYPALLPWILWLTCSIGCLVVLDLFRASRHVAYARYISIASPAVPLLFVGVVWLLRPVWLKYLVAVTMLWTGFIYLVSHNKVLLEAQDYESIVEVIEPRITDDEAIVVHDTHQGTDWRPPVWIMTLSESQKIFPRTILMLKKPINSKLQADLGTRSLWLITNDATNPAQLMPGYRVIEQFSGQEMIQIYRLRAGSPAPASVPTTMPETLSAATSREGAALPSR